MRLSGSADERAAGAHTATSLSSVLHGLNDRGFAILENAVPLEAIEPVHSAYMDSCALGKRLKSPPLSMPFVDHRLIANPLIVQVLRAAMGDKIAWGLYYIHAVPPRSGHEARPHRDGNPLFPELPSPCLYPACPWIFPWMISQKRMVLRDCGRARTHSSTYPLLIFAIWMSAVARWQACA